MPTQTLLFQKRISPETVKQFSYDRNPTVLPAVRWLGLCPVFWNRKASSCYISLGSIHCPTLVTWPDLVARLHLAKDKRLILKDRQLQLQLPGPCWGKSCSHKFLPRSLVSKPQSIVRSVEQTQNFARRHDGLFSIDPRLGSKEKQADHCVWDDSMSL